MMAFFPELADRIGDPRKKQITIHDMLQMRSGYPREETDPELWDALWWGDHVPLIVDFPLAGDLGTDFNYSCLTSNILGIVVARACSRDLGSFAQKHLFSPIGAEVGDWERNRDGYYIGCGDLHFSARDAAKLGLLYLNDGAHGGFRSSPLSG
jgi:CubicO group peptidase (beta-lactamase class C family)